MIEEASLFHQHPFFGVTATVAAYASAVLLWRRLGTPALLHPVLVATSGLALLLVALGMRYEDYSGQTLLLTEALSLVIILLAVPLYRQAKLLREVGYPIIVALGLGSLVALTTALSLPLLLGTSRELLASLAPKSATAAVAVEVAERLGGTAGLTAIVVISTGLFGAVFGPAILRAAGIKDERAIGLALGAASHAIGTARALGISEACGAFASLGMILNSLLTIVLAPLALSLIATP